MTTPQVWQAHKHGGLRHEHNVVPGTEHDHRVQPSTDRHELEVRAESLSRTIATLEAERARIYVAIALIGHKCAVTADSTEGTT